MLTYPYPLRSSSELEEDEDQECLLRLGGDLLVGDLLGGERLGDLLLGDRRSRLRDLTLTERLHDLDLVGRGLIYLLLRCGEGVLQMWFNGFLDRSSSTMRRFCSPTNIV